MSPRVEGERKEPLTRRQRERANLRQRIVAAAIAIAKSDGWENVSIRQIASRIDYTGAALYHHFANKDELIEAVRRYGYSLLIERFQPISDIDPRCRLTSMAERHVDFAFEHPELFAAMFGLRGISIAQSAPLPEQAVVAEMLDENVRALVESGVTSLDFDDRVDVIWASIHGIISLAVFGGLGDAERARRLCVLAIKKLTTPLRGAG